MACVMLLEDTEQIVDDGYCDLTAMPDSERTCWSEDCPDHIPTLPTAAALTTETRHAADSSSSARWRTGTWGHVMILLFLYSIYYLGICYTYPAIL